MLGVFQHSLVVAIHVGIFALGLRVGAADANGAQLIGANAPVEDFLLAGLSIENPASILFDQRNGKRPTVGAQLQHLRGVRLGNQVDLFFDAAHEEFALLLGLDNIA